MIKGKIKNGWFHEVDTLWPGISLSLEVNKILLQETSQFQDILIFESVAYGNVLVLDGVLQTTEKDEYAYHEMMTHIPLFAHSAPKKILVIGGGDGGIVREIAKHNCIQEITLCEIDKKVVDISKEFFPEVAQSLNDPRLKIIFADGAEYLKQFINEFDIIIVDSSDPIGPAESLYTNAFYQLMKKSLKTNGIITSQGENLFLHKNIVQKLLKTGLEHFQFAKYAQVSVPTYPAGSIGIFCCSNIADPAIPKRPLTKEMQLKYYSPEIHEAAFVLPAMFADNYRS